jgi:acyl-CoA synthetase (AMP-forming)/AMP-acid ligase II
MGRVPLVPLNYRLGAAALHELLAEQTDALVVADEPSLPRVEQTGRQMMARDEWTTETAQGVDPDAVEPFGFDEDAVALVLYTSGTTSKPKGAILRHRHLTSYVFGSVEFGSADGDAASLVSVPPYHIAGVANTISNVYAGRRVVQLGQFTPESWLEAARTEQVTHALVVPTMLARVVESLVLEGVEDAGVPSLRSLAYGGARMPLTVIERALELFPGTDFVNAYGLTETSSTIAVLGPEDHREALASDDPAVRARLTSTGKVLPGVEVQVRGLTGEPLGAGEVGEIFVRGPQVSGEYAVQGSVLDEEGWFPTRDRGHVDADGYLFIEGRSDDTIIRGGENIAPAEIEDTLMRHPAVLEAAVVGVPDEEWGQRIAAIVTVRAGEPLDGGDLREWARGQLRTSKTPDVIELWDELPRTDTGKLVRRAILERLLTAPAR